MGVNPIEMVPQGLQAHGTTNPVGVPAGLQRVIPGKEELLMAFDHSRKKGPLSTLASADIFRGGGGKDPKK